jgi:hypothetical protein
VAHGLYGRGMSGADSCGLCFRADIEAANTGKSLRARAGRQFYFFTRIKKRTARACVFSLWIHVGILKANRKGFLFYLSCFEHLQKHDHKK